MSGQLRVKGACLAPLRPTLLRAAAQAQMFASDCQGAGVSGSHTCSCLPQENFALGSLSDPLAWGPLGVSPHLPFTAGSDIPGLCPAPDISYLVILLRFRRFSRPTGSPRSVCCGRCCFWGKDRNAKGKKTYKVRLPETQNFHPLGTQWFSDPHPAAPEQSSCHHPLSVGQSPSAVVGILSCSPPCLPRSHRVSSYSGLVT